MHTDWDHATIAQALDVLRQRHGLTAVAIADRAGVDRSQVSRWRGGGHQPSYEAMRTLAARLRAEWPDPETAGTVDELVTAAGYPDLAGAERPTGAARHSVARRRIESDVGDLVAEIVSDLEADSAGMSDEEAEAMRTAVLENVKRQSEIFAEQERLRIERRRRKNSGE